MMKRALLFFVAFALTISYAQYYDIAIVRVNDSAVQNLVYDDPSFSYKDNSMENSDVDLRICALTAADLQNKYIALAYADGFDGDYIILTHFPAHITSVPPSLCVYTTLEISSFRAWYPSIPYVFISSSPTDFSGASRWKLSRLRGWFIGNYTVVENRSGAVTNINVTDALEDSGASIVPDVNYLVVGLVREDYTTMDTGITSLRNSIQLNADSASAQYKIFINGIGPDTPPYVEIITPEPITYTTGTIPFTYLMIDDDDVSACWYILDGTTVNMPECGPAYIFNVGQGSHTLTLYGEDTTGNVGSDTVNFQVGAPAPAVPPGGGPPGTPFYPLVPPPPPYEFFSITPENIYVIIDYPREEIVEFELYSTIALGNVSCHVTSDFAEYTTVEIDRIISANGTISGTITVNMTPVEILDYDGDTKGLLQCVGETKAPSLLSSTLANVYLVINEPRLLVENVTMDIIAGEEADGIIGFTNIGDGNATAINLTANFTGPYRVLVRVEDITTDLGIGEQGYLEFLVRVPEDLEADTYTIPVEIYENGRLVGLAYLFLNVHEKAVLPYICFVPDLIWTLLILLLGLIVSIYRFCKKLLEVKASQEGKRLMALYRNEKKLKYLWEIYKKPLYHATFTMLIFVVIWIIVVLMLAKCE